MPASFFDAGVLLCLVSGDAVKADLAEAAVAAGGAISVPVLNQITDVARREMRMSWAEIHTFLDIVCALLTVHPLTIECQRAGLRLAERYGFATGDAMTAAAALCAGCDRLWSQDLPHGMTLAEGLAILNPFHGRG